MIYLFQTINKHFNKNAKNEYLLRINIILKKIFKIIIIKLYHLKNSQK